MHHGHLNNLLTVRVRPVDGAVVQLKTTLLLRKQYSVLEETVW